MKIVGRLLGQTTRSLRRQGISTDDISDQTWQALIAVIEEKKIRTKHFEEIVRSLIEKPTEDVSAFLNSIGETLA